MDKEKAKIITSILMLPVGILFYGLAIGVIFGVPIATAYTIIKLVGNLF